MSKRSLVGLKTLGLVSLTILMAFAFIWQRVTLQNLSVDLQHLEDQLRLLERNRDYLKKEVVREQSLDQVSMRAAQELGLQETPREQAAVLSDSLLRALSTRPDSIRVRAVNAVQSVPDVQDSLRRTSGAAGYEN